MSFRTYRLGGDFISIDTSITAEPAGWDEWWEIDAAAYAALNAHAVPVVTDADQIVIAGDTFEAPPDEPPPEEPTE